MREDRARSMDDALPRRRHLPHHHSAGHHRQGSTSKLELVAAADAAISHSLAEGERSQRSARGSSIATAVGSIVTAPGAFLRAFNPRPRDLQRGAAADILPTSTELETYNWFCETLAGYRLDEWKTQPWKRRFLQNKMNGAALLAVRSDKEMRDVFGVELKGVRARLLQDIEHERANQSATDNTATMDARLRQVCYILFATCSMGFMLIELSQILIPVVLSFALTGFMLPIVDALNKRPTRCCASTYPTYCIDGYEEFMPSSIVQDRKSRQGCWARLIRGFLLCILPRSLATVIAVLAVFGVVAVIVLIIAFSVEQASDNFDEYEEKIESIVNASNEYLLGLGLNQSDVDGLYDRLPAAALAMGGATTAAKAWFDFCIIILFATYLVIEKGGTRQAPGYINARVYKKFMEPFNPNQPPGQRRQRLAPLHKQLDRSIQRKLREHYDVFVTAFDEFDVHGDGLLSPDEFRIGLTRFVKGFFNITEINKLRDALIELHEAYRLKKQTTFKQRVLDDISSYMYWKVTFSALTGGAMALTLGMFQVDLWGMFGVLSFVLNFIPTLGGFIACLLTLPILVMDPDLDFYTSMAAFFVVVGIHLLIGTVLEPITFGRRYQVHPIAVVISLTVWVSMWGVVGAFISTPFLIVITIGLEGQPHPVAKGLFRAIKGSLTGTTLRDAITKRRARRPRNATEKGPQGSVGRANSAVGSGLSVVRDSDNDSPAEERKVSTQRSWDAEVSPASSAQRPNLFPVSPSPRKGETDRPAGSPARGTVSMVIQSVVSADKRAVVEVKAGDTATEICQKLPEAMRIVTDKEGQEDAKARIDAAKSKGAVARKALEEAYERLAQMEESSPVDARSDGGASEDEKDKSKDKSKDKEKEREKEKRKEARVEKKKEKAKASVRTEVKNCLQAVIDADEELDAAKSAAQRVEEEANYSGCLISDGRILTSGEKAGPAGLLGSVQRLDDAATTQAGAKLWFCQSAAEKSELVLERWCFCPLPHSPDEEDEGDEDGEDDQDDGDESGHWGLVTLEKVEQGLPYALKEHYRVDAVELHGSEGWVHLRVKRLGDHTDSCVRHFLLDNFRPRWLEQARGQIDLRRVFEGLARQPSALVDFVHTNLGTREPKLWNFTPPLSALFLDESGAWPLREQRWVVLFGAEGSDSRWCVLELKKAVRGGSYESIALPLPIVSIEPLPPDAPEGDNDEIRILVRHPLELCPGSYRAYSLSMFEWRWFERGASADAGLSQRFARLCPTPEDRSHMFELEAKAQKVQELRSRHGMASSDNDTDGEGEDRSSPDLGQTRALLFERKRADAELEAGRVRLDDMQRQFRSFLETNCHVLEQTEWMWPERARSFSSLAGTPVRATPTRRTLARSTPRP